MEFDGSLIQTIYRGGEAWKKNICRRNFQNGLNIIACVLKKKTTLKSFPTGPTDTDLASP